MWATWFRALGDPSRIVILNLLATAGRAMSVGEIVERLGLAQSTVSHHLKILGRSGSSLVDREATSSWWRVNERCLACFPSAAEVVMGRVPVGVAPWDEPTRLRQQGGAMNEPNSIEAEVRRYYATPRSPPQKGRRRAVAPRPSTSAPACTTTWRGSPTRPRWPASGAATRSPWPTSTPVKWCSISAPAAGSTCCCRPAGSGHRQALRGGLHRRDARPGPPQRRRGRRRQRRVPGGPHRRRAAAGRARST